MTEAISTADTPTATRTSIESGDAPHSIRNGLFCALVFAACWLIANPSANMPFIDDFSYIKTALDFARTGHIHYNGWATAMLGWQIPWGALFIKLFGFSFNVMRLSMLPIAMTSVYLFHLVLRRFGVTPGNAVFGALTMALSPLFMPLAASYMSDVPGLFVTVLCIYLCQRALAAPSDRSAVLWLCFATLVSVGGGTARQTAWLGALIMVPSTAWLLRNRQGVKTAAILLWIFSLIGVLACMHWFRRQPYSVPTSHLLQGGIHLRMVAHLSAQLLKTFLCLLLIVFPVTVTWLSTMNQLSRKSWLRLAAVGAILPFAAILLFRHGSIGGWLIPWLIVVLDKQWNFNMVDVTHVTAILLIRYVASILVIAPVLLLAEQMATGMPREVGVSNPSSSWREVAWIFGPFSIASFMLLVPLGTYLHLQDRYVLGLVPGAIAFFCLLCQERTINPVPAFSILTLLLVAFCSVAGTHDIFADYRARVQAIHNAEASGVSRSSIQADLESDGWFQIENGGHMNEPHIAVPANAYVPNNLELAIPAGCRFWFTTYTPAIVPRYFLVHSPKPCFAPTRFPPVHYSAWLPPFHRALYVQQLKSDAN